VQIALTAKYVGVPVPEFMKWPLTEAIKWSRSMQTFIRMLFGSLGRGGGEDGDTDILKALSTIDDEAIQVVFKD